jgi:hypothetical protein
LPPKTQIASNACWILQEKKILIRSDYTNKLMNFSRSLLWECCNAANWRLNSTKFLHLSPDEDTYAFLVEALEFFSSSKTDEIIIDYLMSAQQNPSLLSMIEESGKKKVSKLIDIKIASRENFMEYWHRANQEVVGSNYKGMQNNNDLYRHSDVYRSYYYYLKKLDFIRLSDHIGDNEWDLIVNAFSQKSFALAKKETKLLKLSNGQSDLKKQQEVTKAYVT